MSQESGFRALDEVLAMARLCAATISSADQKDLQSDEFLELALGTLHSCFKVVTGECSFCEGAETIALATLLWLQNHEPTRSQHAFADLLLRYAGNALASLVQER